MKLRVTENLFLSLYKTIWITTIYLLLSFQSAAQNEKVSAIIDTMTIFEGGQTHLIFEASEEAGEKIKFPVLEKSIIDEIEVIKIFPIDTISANKKSKRLRQRVLIQGWDSGYYYLEPFIFITKKANQTLDTLYSKELYLEITRTPVDTSASPKPHIANLNTPLTFKEFITEYYLYIIGFVMVSIISVLLYFWHKKRKSRPQEIKIIVSKELPHVIALRSLDELKSNKLWQSGNTKEYYTKLTDIMREYIEKRFGISALEQTSYEILTVLKNESTIKREVYEKLKQMLTLADFVKFAKAKPIPVENEKNIENAYLFVNETITIKDSATSNSDTKENLENLAVS